MPIKLLQHNPFAQQYFVCNRQFLRTKAQSFFGHFQRYTFYFKQDPAGGNPWPRNIREHLFLYPYGLQQVFW